MNHPPVKESSTNNANETHATKLVRLVPPSCLFHSGDECFASLHVNGHQENWPLRSKGFKNWLNHQYFQREGKTPGSSATQSAIETLSGQALFCGPEHRVFIRIAEHEGAIYLDLANDAWETIEITSQGWTVVVNPPVKFRRARGMLPLLRPIEGGSIEDLRPLVNVSLDDWPLLIAWLVAAFRPKGPYPVLALHGEQGSAKSTLASVLRALIDPNIAPKRSEPKEPRDLMIAATNSWIISLDNMSHLKPWLSDAICRLSTGGGFATRELFSDNEEIIFEAQRPVILNGIEELATRGDLLDRASILYLPEIPENKRRTEAAVWADVERIRPRLLGALLEAASYALQELPNVCTDGLPRMADFAQWVIAAEPCLGWKPGTFMKAYAAKRAEANELTLEASHIVAPLRALLDECQTWEGTATELLKEITKHLEHSDKPPKGWPTNGNKISNALRRLSPNLRATGLSVDFRRGRRRLIRLEYRAISSSLASSPSSSGARSLNDDDATVTHDDVADNSLPATRDDADDAEKPDYFDETNAGDVRP